MGGDEARSERPNGFQSMRATPNVAQGTSQPVRGVNNRHCQGRSRRTLFATVALSKRVIRVPPIM